MSGNFPTTVKLSKVKIQSLTSTLESVTHNLNRQVRTRGGQRWTLEGDYTTIGREDWAEMFAFAMKQRGKYGTFQFTHPAVSNPYGTISGTPTVDSGQVPARTLDISGVTPASTWKKTSFFKFTGHAKVYMLTEDFTADGGGQGTITFEPAVQETLISGEAIVYSDVPFTMSMQDDVLETLAKTNWAYELQIKMVESP